VVIHELNKLDIFCAVTVTQVIRELCQ